MRAARTIAVLLALAACAGVRGTVDPEIVGTYTCPSIDTPEAIDLLVDGTFVMRRLGVDHMPIFGHWFAADGLVELHGTEIGWRGERRPIPADLIAEHTWVFVFERGDSKAVLVDASVEPDLAWRRGMEWTRGGPPAEPRWFQAPASRSFL